MLREPGGLLAKESRFERGICVVVCQGFGDVVQSLPLLKAICGRTKDRAPVYVLFATPEHYELVCDEIPGVKAVFIRGITRSLSRILVLIRELRGKAEILVAAPEVSSIKMALLKRLIAAPWTVGEAPKCQKCFLDIAIEENRKESFLEAQQKIANAIGLAAELPNPSLSPTLAEREFSENTLRIAGLNHCKPLVGIQCGTAVAAKRWPIHGFAGVIHQLLQIFPEIGFVSFGDRTEAALAHATQLLAGARKACWLEGAGRWRIRETAAMMDRCDLFISGDTGLMHIAAALGVKTLSIFGPTSPVRRAPRYNGGIALAPRAPCGQCLRRKKSECRCIAEVSIEQVVASAEELLNRTAHPLDRELAIGAEKAVSR